MSGEEKSESISYPAPDVLGGGVASAWEQFRQEKLGGYRKPVFCINCEHLNLALLACERPYLNLVTGEAVRMRADAAIERQGLTAGACGPEGRFYTARPKTAAP